MSFAMAFALVSIPIPCDVSFASGQTLTDVKIQTYVSIFGQKNVMQIRLNVLNAKLSSLLWPIYAQGFVQKTRYDALKPKQKTQMVVQYRIDVGTKEEKQKEMM